MKSFRFFYLLAATLAGFWMLLSLSTQDKTYPSADSYRPSGMRALSDLLRSQGYVVSSSRSANPLKNPGDVGIAVTIVDNESSDRFIEEYTKNVEVPTKLLLLSLNSDFQSASARASAAVTPVRWHDGRIFKINHDSNHTAAFLPDAGISVPLTTSLGSGLASLESLGRSSVIQAPALPFTNRFIDKAENAELAMTLVQMVAKPGSRLVFCEAAFDDSVESGLLDAFGGWAKAAWTQVLLLGAIVIYSLGKRFGYPEEARFREQGGRELIEAISGTYSRGKFSGHALRAMIDDADWRLRRALRISRDSTRAARDKLLPTDLAQAIAEAEVVLQSNPKPHQIEKAARKLDALLHSFLSRSNRRGPLP